MRTCWDPWTWILELGWNLSYGFLLAGIVQYFSLVSKVKQDNGKGPVFTSVVWRKAAHFWALNSPRLGATCINTDRLAVPTGPSRIPCRHYTEQMRLVTSYVGNRKGNVDPGDEWSWIYSALTPCPLCARHWGTSVNRDILGAGRYSDTHRRKGLQDNEGISKRWHRSGVYLVAKTFWSACQFFLRLFYTKKNIFVCVSVIRSFNICRRSSQLRYRNAFGRLSSNTRDYFPYGPSHVFF